MICSLLLLQPLSNDPRFNQCITITVFVEVYILAL